jgi:hypothetical protein
MRPAGKNKLADLGAFEVRPSDTDAPPLVNPDADRHTSQDTRGRKQNRSIFKFVTSISLR